MATRTLTVTDTETNETIKVPITNNCFSAAAFGKLQITPTTPPGEPGEKVPLRLYDPGFKNTAVCNTKISMVDPDGKLYYRGYDVEELFEKSSFLEVAYLLIHGELPNAAELNDWTNNIMNHTYLHSQLERQMLTFRYDAHPMGMLIATIASLSTFTPEANPAIHGDNLFMGPKVANPTPSQSEELENAKRNRYKVIYRALGKVPTIASAAYRHRLGRTYNHPMHGSLNYCENLLYMMDRLNEPNYVPDPRLVKILDKLFILMAEHGVNCSAVMVRHLASSGVDPYTALAGAAGALFGERKSSEVITMLSGIKSVDDIDGFLDSIKNSKRASLLDPKLARLKLNGFGHRIYKTTDPRAVLCKKIVLELFDLMGLTHNGKIALALEEKALNDEWFTSRNLYPNVDYWLALAFDRLEFPNDMFPVWMFIPRVPGFLAHLVEALDDPEYKIYRPRQIYVGEGLRPYDDNGLVSPEAEPALDSVVVRNIRPSSKIEPLPASIYEELGDVDLFEPASPKPGKPAMRLRSWVRKRFKFKSDEELSNDAIVALQNEIKDLRLKQMELKNALEKDQVSTLKVDSMVNRARSVSKNRTATIDIMAGSSNSRVIAPKK